MGYLLLCYVVVISPITESSWNGRNLLKWACIVYPYGVYFTHGQEVLRHHLVKDVVVQIALSECDVQAVNGEKARDSLIYGCILRGKVKWRLPKMDTGK